MSGILRTEIELRDPKSLTPYQHNNKKHPPSQIKKLCRTIAEHGFDQPIVIDRKAVVIKGHGRLAAALEMKLKLVPVIVADNLTPEQVRAARLADNAVADDAAFDFDAIKFELSELSDLGMNLEFTGFDDAELDRFLSDLPTTEYQAPQVFGSNENWEVVQGRDAIEGKIRELSEDELETEQLDSSGNASQEPVQDRFPLPIVLSWQEWQSWKSVKEEFGVKSDKAVLLKLMEER